MTNHTGRAHSKFSASGAERWFNCPGSVALSEGVPDKSSPWAEEGTQAHEVLELLMRCELSGNDGADVATANQLTRKVPHQMVAHADSAVNFIMSIAKEHNAEVGVEERVYLDFIHPEMFGTYDSRVVEHFGTLHVFDYKYGAGHGVSPRENLQMIFYGIGVAHKYDWNFKRLRLWVIQPRIKGYDGPVFWDVSISDLKNIWVPKFQEAVDRVEREPNSFNEGSWCHWCKAKSKCPLKREAKIEQAQMVFGTTKGKVEHGKKETTALTKKEGRKKDPEKESREKRRLAKKGWQKKEENPGEREDFF